MDFGEKYTEWLNNVKSEGQRTEKPIIDMSVCDKHCRELYSKNASPKDAFNCLVQHGYSDPEYVKWLIDRPQRDDTLDKDHNGVFYPDPLDDLYDSEEDN